VPILQSKAQLLARVLLATDDYGAQTAHLRRSSLSAATRRQCQEFNRRKAQGEKSDLTSCDLRYVDLRGLDAADIDFSNSYFRSADLRGVDFSKARLEGARISGALFPAELSSAEITLSVDHGMRMRY